MLSEAIDSDRRTVHRGLADMGESFDVVFATMWPRIYAYVWLMLRQREDAEDLAAETFERAYGAWAKGHGPKGDVVPWLLLIARRLVIDRQRRRMLVAWLPLRSIPDPPGDDLALRNSESWLWFARLRDTVSPRQYEALLLRYQFGLADPEVGRLMGLSEPGVRTLVSRAIAVLRRHPEVL